MVMLSHFDNLYSNYFIACKNQLAHYLGYFIADVYDGTAAVIAFFLVSGFVIHYPNKNGIRDLKQFWLRRYIRIIIPLAVICIIGIYQHPERLLWSLVCELAYYTVYPFLSKINISWRNKFFIAYAISAVLIVVGAHRDVYAFIHQDGTTYHGYYWQMGFFLTWIVGLPCWLLGVLIAEQIDKLTYISNTRVMLYRVLVILVGFICNVLKEQHYVSYVLSMNVIAPVIYLWLRAEIVYYKTRPSVTILENMGKFSYSLYICHPIIYLALLRFVPYNMATYPLYIIICIGFSYCFYLLVERPSHRLAQRVKFNKGLQTN
jgi:peptidoglycan/LPS O-acetylase OafA/YrhL